MNRRGEEQIVRALRDRARDHGELTYLMLAAADVIERSWNGSGAAEPHTGKLAALGRTTEGLKAAGVKMRPKGARP